jgi:GAF domain-containing protein
MPDAEVQEFDDLAQMVLNGNSNAIFAAVNLILKDAQHPIGTCLRQSDDTSISNRKLAHISHTDSICYYLAHEPLKGFLIKKLPPGNSFGASTYVSHVPRNSKGKRVGALCQVADLRDQADTEKQIKLLKQLAGKAEDHLEEQQPALQIHDPLLREQVESCGGGDEVILPSCGLAKAVKALQLCNVIPNDYPSPKQLQATGKPQNSSKLPAYRQGLATYKYRLVRACA